MMISNLGIDWQIEEKKHFIQLTIENLMTLNLNKEQILRCLESLRHFEDELHKLEEKKQ